MKPPKKDKLKEGLKNLFKKKEKTQKSAALDAPHSFSPSDHSHHQLNNLNNEANYDD
jgi:hypothetical protein